MVMVWLIFVFLSIVLQNSAEGVVVHKANVGETVILPCPSNDKVHRFQYWQLKDDQIIGPWNNNQENKFTYEVWSGRLIIRSVSDTESGFYKCFSKQILGSELRSETVELLVIRDWEESFENDPTVNTYRIIIAVLILLIFIMLASFAFFIKRRRTAIFQDLREESPEELLPSTNNKSVYKPTNISFKRTSPNKHKMPDRSLENAVVETDISTSFPVSNYN